MNNFSLFISSMLWSFFWSVIQSKTSPSSSRLPAKKTVIANREGIHLNILYIRKVLEWQETENQLTSQPIEEPTFSVFKVCALKFWEVYNEPFCKVSIFSNEDMKNVNLSCYCLKWWICCFFFLEASMFFMKIWSGSVKYIIASSCCK